MTAIEAGRSLVSISLSLSGQCNYRSEAYDIPRDDPGRDNYLTEYCPSRQQLVPIASSPMLLYRRLLPQPTVPGCSPRRLLRLRLMSFQHLPSHDAAIDVAEAINTDTFRTAVGKVA